MRSQGLSTRTCSWRHHDELWGSHTNERNAQRPLKTAADRGLLGDESEPPSCTPPQRYGLRSEGIRVIELAPPWVRTELLNGLEEERAMALDSFLADTMTMLGTVADEILVGQAPAMRANPGPQEPAWVMQFDDLIAAGPSLG